MPRFCFLLKLLIVYLLLAIAFNLVSIWMINANDIGLVSDSDPRESIKSLMLLIPVLWLGFTKRYTVFAIANTLLIALLIYKGVLPHIECFLDDDYQRYSSLAAWASALAVNSFGSIVGICASIVALRLRKRSIRAE